MKTGIRRKAAGIPPLPERQTSAKEKARVVRFEVSPATMIFLALVVACMWLLLRLWPIVLEPIVLEPIVLVLVVALFIVGTMSPPSAGWSAGCQA